MGDFDFDFDFDFDDGHGEQEKEELPKEKFWILLEFDGEKNQEEIYNYLIENNVICKIIN